MPTHPPAHTETQTQTHTQHRWVEKAGRGGQNSPTTQQAGSALTKCSRWQSLPGVEDKRRGRGEGSSESREGKKTGREASTLASRVRNSSYLFELASSAAKGSMEAPAQPIRPMSSKDFPGWDTRRRRLQPEVGGEGWDAAGFDGTRTASRQEEPSHPASQLSDGLSRQRGPRSPCVGGGGGRPAPARPKPGRRCLTCRHPRQHRRTFLSRKHVSSCRGGGRRVPSVGSCLLLCVRA